MSMSPDQAGAFVRSTLSVTREDVARAKSWIVQATLCDTGEMAARWLQQQSLSTPEYVQADAPNCHETLTTAAHVYGVRLAFYQAMWELIAAGELFPAGDTGDWKPSLELRTSGHRGGIPFQISCLYPMRVQRPPCVSDVTNDADVFLKGIDCKTINRGIGEAIQQSLDCFRRGLYMPAIAMLAAGAEATWIECGLRIATTKANAKLDRVLKDPYSSISKKVTEIHKSLDRPDGRQLLKTANRSIADVAHAEVWTSTLRERRNALHWSKAASFIAHHGEAGTFLMAAPQHIATLEAIRVAC
jgi:hypothetical protein